MVIWRYLVGKPTLVWVREKCLKTPRGAGWVRESSGLASSDSHIVYNRADSVALSERHPGLAYHGEWLMLVHDLFPPKLSVFLEKTQHEELEPVQSWPRPK